ncbi:MAG: bifunctional 4-hydroxy-2-oxoglutarate aldolase/2-dehydro-3-deoxy-phosphogluconate aldolase [Pseudomonadota bacterium]
MIDIGAIMRTGSVIPVLVVHDAADARPLAEALVRDGFGVVEVTLRTDCALEAIAEMRKVDDVIVGAGTVLNAGQLNACAAAGAQFAVSPGLTEPLARAAHAAGMPFLPGVANAGDIMRGLDLGIDHFKFFPAEASGGIAALKALAAPFAECRFCPTGGITEETAADWLALDSVLCVGRSWRGG